ncbi:glycosyltransferase family 61 protein [Acidomyces richmondensis BFW]|nr:glycosyltransferase family 61 protein [Acidomyces richmondensis BFW]
MHTRFAVALIFSILVVTYLYLPSTWLTRVPDATEDVHDKVLLRTSNLTSECSTRYGSGYLEAFRKTATQYCETTSTSSIFCFSHNAIDKRTDSFCVGGPAILQPDQNLVKLDCKLREWEEEDIKLHVPKLQQFPSYWYNTGPRAIFAQHIQLDRLAVVNPDHQGECKGFSLAVKREKNNDNLWHTMMEIMSLTMSLDILGLATNPKTGKSFFIEEDVMRSQVLILDDLPDGPFFDLWAILARLPTVRLREIPSSINLGSTCLVVPLPGGSNPFWHGDWTNISCGESELLKKFSRRVLDFYNITTNYDTPSEKPLTITFVDRQEKRRLLYKDQYVQSLRSQYPDINIQLVDFASIPLIEQIQIAHSTNILVGVHGAGLTHGMFLMPNSTVVEILPPKLDHHGFDNMAKFLGHRYFSRHGVDYVSEVNTGDWQHDDVYISKDEFLQLMQSAITDTRARRKSDY